MKSWIAIAIAAVAAVVGLASFFITKKQDNPIEEACEEMIKHQIGIDIDLTPGSREGEGNGGSK